MHPVHNCHNIKSFHPPVKQYIATHHNTEFIYPFTIFICNTKVSKARGALWVVLFAVYWSESSSGYLPWSFPPSVAPLFPPSVAPPFLAPSSARFPLSSLPCSIPSSLVPFLIACHEPLRGTTLWRRYLASRYDVLKAEWLLRRAVTIVRDTSATSY